MTIQPEEVDPTPQERESVTAGGPSNAALDHYAAWKEKQELRR